MVKKTQFLLLALLLALPFNGYAQQPLRGDVDYDGTVSISDVLMTIDYLLKGSWSDDPVTPPTEGDWVDLGLPSGTIWATRNIGASAPEDYGYYFAWGETTPTPKDNYDWSTYKWCKGNDNTLTKYCTNSDYGYNGFTDGKTELDPEDDAAYVNWGSVARMPSLEQIKELRDNCNWQWTERNGVNGQLVTGPNGNTIFLPAAGAVSWGLYWSRTLDPDLSAYACNLFFASWSVDWYDDLYRLGGFSVRAVRVSQN